MRARFNFHTVKSKAAAISDNRFIFIIMAFTLVLSFALYLVLVNETVRNVAKRQMLEAEMSALNSHIGELEFKYISLRNDITLDTAYALGFQSVVATKFVARKSLSSATFARVQ